MNLNVDKKKIQLKSDQDTRNTQRVCKTSSTGYSRTESSCTGRSIRRRNLYGYGSSNETNSSAQCGGRAGSARCDADEQGGHHGGLRDLSGDDFYQTAYGILFNSMVELFHTGKPVDLITLQEYLKEKDVPPEISSMEFARDLLMGTQTSANIKSYAEIVREKSIMRRLIKVNEETANACYLENQPLEEILEDHRSRCLNLQKLGIPREYVPIKQVVLNALDVIERASKTKGKVTGIPTGFIDLDYKLSGLQRSDLVLIAARPSMGKTAFVLNIAQHVAFRQNIAVAIFSLEMSKEQLVNRLFSLESHVDAQILRNGNLTDTDWEKLIEGAGTIGSSQYDHRRYVGYHYFRDALKV